MNELSRPDYGVMVQPEMENHPILLSDYPNRCLQLRLWWAKLLVGRFTRMACGGQLATTLGHDLLVTPFELRWWCDIAKAAVQAHRVILVHKTRHDATPTTVGEASARPSVVNGWIPSRLTVLCQPDFALPPASDSRDNPAI